MLTTTRLCLCLLTYNRFEYAKRTLHSTLNNIKFSGELSIHIGDDGSPDSLIYRNSLFEEIEAWDSIHKFTNLSSSDSEQGGYGKNYNLAMQAIHSNNDYVLVLEDDWELRRELDLDFIISSMMMDQRLACIRLGYVGYTQPLHGEFIYVNGMNWLLLDPDSPEPHVFAGHPRIEAVTFQRRVGPWPEGLQPGATEFAVTHIREAREGVVWPVELVKPSGDLYHHIGTIRSY